jgi:Leucine-rich repeat (LRR) protein
LEGLENLTSLDLSYNKIKHIKGVKHLKKLKELFFVQNGISRIEELAGLTSLVSLELGANKIRVLPQDKVNSGNHGSRHVNGRGGVMAREE